MKYSLISLLFVSVVLMFAGCEIEPGNGELGGTPLDEEAGEYNPGEEENGPSGNNNGDPGGTSIDEYKVKPSDVIQVDGNKDPAMNKQVRVDDRGYVKLLYIGRVKVKGQTKWEIEELLEEKYKKYFVDPQITIEILNLSFFIGGEVKQGGQKQLIGNLTLTQAIVAAGDYTTWADKTKVKIKRKGPGGKKDIILKFNCEKIEKGEAEDPYIKPGDTITVPR